MSPATKSPGVNVLDRVVLPLAEVGPWLERWRSDYAPRAAARGLTLEKVWRAYDGPDSVSVHVLWSLADTMAFFRMRGAAGPDGGVAEFWAYTDSVALDRGRQVLEVLDSPEPPSSTPIGGTE